jgi:transposase-like protein
MIAGQSCLAPVRLWRGPGDTVMAGFTRPVHREERRAWWRRQLARQQSANLSVAEFCRQLGVSLTTFYYWKKRASEAMPNASGGSSAEHSSRPVTESTAATVPSFLPVSILEAAAGPQLEIELANASVLRLKGAMDPSWLQAAITAAGQLDGTRQGAN